MKKFKKINKETVGKTVAFVGSLGLSQVAANIVVSTMPAQISIPGKILTHVGSVAIASIVSTRGEKLMRQEFDYWTKPFVGLDEDGNIIDLDNKTIKK